MDDPRRTYSQAFDTMTAVMETLRSQPDDDGAIAGLIRTIERERAWVTSNMVTGRLPARPPPWNWNPAKLAEHRST